MKQSMRWPKGIAKVGDVIPITFGEETMGTGKVLSVEVRDDDQTDLIEMELDDTVSAFIEKVTNDFIGTIDFSSVSEKPIGVAKKDLKPGDILLFKE